MLKSVNNLIYLDLKRQYYECGIHVLFIGIDGYFRFLIIMFTFFQQNSSLNILSCEFYLKKIYRIPVVGFTLSYLILIPILMYILKTLSIIFRKRKKNKKSYKVYNTSICVICLENDTCILLKPCKHKCLCLRCAFTIIQKDKFPAICPVCRSNVNSLSEPTIDWIYYLWIISQFVLFLNYLHWFILSAINLIKNFNFSFYFILFFLF